MNDWISLQGKLDLPVVMLQKNWTTGQLQADWLIYENNGKATLNIKMSLSHAGTELASSAGSIGDNLTITIYVNLR